MSRLNFLVKYKQKVGGTDEYRTTCNCILRVAKFFGIEDLFYTPSPEDLVDRASYTREYVKPDGTVGTVTVAAGKSVYTPNNKPRGKRVFFKTGAKTTKGTYKTVSMTFPTVLTVGDISDILGELIPAGKIQRTATAPTATEIFPFFTLEGGGTYPIPLNATAAATATPAVALTEAAQTTIATTTKSRKKKVVVP